MPDQETDLKRYAAATQRGLILGGLAVIILIGLALIALFFGPSSAGIALLCFAGLLVPVLLIVGFLSLLQWIVRRANKED